MEYVLQENDKGKYAPQKIGMAPIMRDGVEYEFTTVFDLDTSHKAQVSKDRTQMFSDRIFQLSETTGKKFIQWLNQEGKQKSSSMKSKTTSTNGVV